MTLLKEKLDTIDYKFNIHYVKMVKHRAIITSYYLQHIRESAAHFEFLSRTLYGRVIPLILLLHANQLNADHLGDVLQALKDRGYTFISIEEALRDPAYKKYGFYPPQVVAKGDRNFLNQVAVSRGMKPSDPSGDNHFKTYWLPRIKKLAP